VPALAAGLLGGAVVDAATVRSAQEIDVFVALSHGLYRYVADHARMKLIPEHSRNVYAAACAGAISQNVYLYVRRQARRSAHGADRPAVRLPYGCRLEEGAGLHG
jgi:hypothetical protein